MLLGQVDVDIGLPIGLALGGKRVGLLGVRNLDIAGLLVIDSVLYLLGERVAVDGPAKVAALYSAFLTVGACPPAGGAHGVKAVGELGGPAADLRRIERGVGRIGKADPLQHRAAVDLAGIVAVELKGHVDAQEVVGGIACSLNLVVGEGAVERFVGVVADLGDIDVLGERRELDLGIFDDMLAVDLLVGTGFLNGKLAGLLVIGAGGLEGARAALVELVDGAAQAFLKLLLVKGIGEHGQVDVLVQVDRVVLGSAIGFAAERRDEARWPQQRLVFADNLVGGLPRHRRWARRTRAGRVQLKLSSETVSL